MVLSGYFFSTYPLNLWFYFQSQQINQKIQSLLQSLRKGNGLFLSLQYVCGLLIYFQRSRLRFFIPNVSKELKSQQTDLIIKSMKRLKQPLKSMKITRSQTRVIKYKKSPYKHFNVLVVLAELIRGSKHANIQLYISLINMETHNRSIRSTLERRSSNDIFVPKDTFYGKFTHLRRGVRKMPSQNPNRNLKIKNEEQRTNILKEASKSLSIHSQFERKKPKEVNFNHLLLKTQTVSLSLKNRSFSTEILKIPSQKTNSNVRKKVIFMNGNQACIKRTYEQKDFRDCKGCIKQTIKPLSIIQVILSKNNRKQKKKQTVENKSQLRSKTLPNNFECQEIGKQTSFKTTTLQSVSPYLERQSFYFQQERDNQVPRIEIQSPRYQGKMGRQKQVLIIQKSSQLGHRSRQRQCLYIRQSKASKVIQKINIKVNSDNLVGPWSKNNVGMQEVQETYRN